MSVSRQVLSVALLAFSCDMAIAQSTVDEFEKKVLAGWEQRISGQKQDRFTRKTKEPCVTGGVRNFTPAIGRNVGTYNSTRCFREARYCGVENALEPEAVSLMESQQFQRCANELWSLVGKKDWDGVVYLQTRMKNGEFDRASRKSKKPPAPPQPLVQPVTPLAPPSGKSGGRHNYGTDIDDLDASDIEIMDVVEDEPKSQDTGKYCECRGGDIELHGLCSPDGVGLYEKGKHPWTSACKVTVGGRVNLQEWSDNYNRNRR